MCRATRSTRARNTDPVLQPPGGLAGHFPAFLVLVRDRMIPVEDDGLWWKQRLFLRHSPAHLVEVQPRILERRIEAECLSQMDRGVIQLIHLGERGTEIAVRIGQARIAPDRLAELVGGLSELVVLQKRSSQIVMPVGVVRREPGRLPRAAECSRRDSPSDSWPRGATPASTSNW
jgi:hypothetical protein